MTNKDFGEMPEELKADLEKLKQLKETDPAEYSRKLQAFNEALREFNAKALDLINSVNKTN